MGLSEAQGESLHARFREAFAPCVFPLFEMMF